ncbi:MAG: FAD:protein FMN transferase, partial [Actinomycetota bacterium]|nr:FAD:protein FMN transferase [Actinomycetota bacterium]
LRRTVEEFDLACSRFRADSELCALNRAAGATVRVSPLLLEAVGASLRAARLTDGDIDPTVGGALISLGYDRDFDSIAPGGPISVVSVPGWRTVEIDAQASTVRLAAGVELDLGATAKALAADRAAARAQATSGCGVLVSLGGDVSVAGAAPASGWRVRVTDDHRSSVEAPGQWISLSGGGLATSSSAVRRWRTASGMAHHLIDPGTGAPAAVFWRTVSVAAGSCLDANIASTAAIVRGRRASRWLASLDLPSRLVSAEGRVTHVAGWPSLGDDLEPVAPSFDVSGGPVA